MALRSTFCCSASRRADAVARALAEAQRRGEAAGRAEAVEESDGVIRAPFPAMHEESPVVLLRLLLAGVLVAGRDGHDAVRRDQEAGAPQEEED